MRFVLTVVFSIITTISFAQRQYGDFRISKFQNGNITGTRDISDTVRPRSFIPLDEGGLGCFQGIYNAPDSGYVSGNNQYGDKEKAQFFSLSKLGLSGATSLQSVAVKFGLKTFAPFPDDIRVNVYSLDDSTHLPDSLLSTSNTVALPDINTEGELTVFTFPTPVTIPDSFLISVQLPINHGDTVAIVSSVDECREYSGWSWERWSNDTWHTILNSWLLDIDLAIFPVVDLPTGIHEPGFSSRLNIYPNPSDGNTEIFFSLSQPESVLMQVVDLRGQLIEQRSLGNFSAGTHGVQLDLSKYANGLYHINIITPSSSTGKELVIEKL